MDLAALAKQTLTPPTYHETLPYTATSPVRDEIERIVPQATAEQVDALEQLVNHEVLDKADRIVRRLQKYTRTA